MQGNQTFFIDKAGPGISITYPSNTTYESVSYLDFTATGASPLSCQYSTDGGATRHSAPCTGGVAGLMPTEGGNLWIAYANDSAGNSNSTEVSFTVDSSGLAITIVSPLNGSRQAERNVLLNISINREGECNWSMDGGAETPMQTQDNLSFASEATGIDAGGHTASFACTGRYGAPAYTDTYFEIFTPPPPTTGGGGGQQSTPVSLASVFNCSSGELRLQTTPAASGATVRLVKSGEFAPSFSTTDSSGRARFAIVSDGTYSAEIAGAYYGSISGMVLTRCPIAAVPEVPDAPAANNSTVLGNLNATAVTPMPSENATAETNTSEQLPNATRNDFEKDAADAIEDAREKMASAKAAGQDTGAAEGELSLAVFYAGTGNYLDALAHAKKAAALLQYAGTEPGFEVNAAPIVSQQDPLQPALPACASIILIAAAGAAIAAKTRKKRGLEAIK